MRTLGLVAGLTFFGLYAMAANAAVDPAVAQQWKQEQIAQMVAVKGSYRNEEYGFGVPIPASAEAYRAGPIVPNHGVLYVLGYQRTVTVSAMFDAAEYGSTKVQLDNWLADEHPDSLKRTPTVLAGKPAEQAVLQTGHVVNKVVVQRRNQDHGILYEVTLTTTAEDQAQDSVFFDSVVAGFKTYKLPK